MANDTFDLHAKVAACPMHRAVKAPGEKWDTCTCPLTRLALLEAVADAARARMDAEPEQVDEARARLADALASLLGASVKSPARRDPVRARDAAREFFGCNAEGHSTLACQYSRGQDSWGYRCQELEALLLRAAAGGRERACRAICKGCRDGLAIRPDTEDHEHPTIKNADMNCEAAAIRQLTEEA